MGIVALYNFIPHSHCYNIFCSVVSQCKVHEASATYYIIIYKMILTSNCSRKGDYFIYMLEELIKRLLCASLHPRVVLAAGWAPAFQSPYLKKSGALIHQVQRLSSKDEGGQCNPGPSGARLQSPGPRPSLWSAQCAPSAGWLSSGPIP